MALSWDETPGPVDLPSFPRAVPPALAVRAKRLGHEEIIGLVGVLASTVGAAYGASGAETLAIHYNRDSRRIRKDKPFRAGMPDLVIAGPGGVMFVEVKGKDDTVSPEQRTWLARLLDAGQTAVIWEAIDVMNGRAETELAALCVRYAHRQQPTG